MKRLLMFVLAAVLVLTPITAMAEEEVYEGYKIEESDLDLVIDGEEADVETYLVSNWDHEGEEPRERKQIVVKLRDLAALLNDTEGKFDVAYNGEKDAVEITTGKAYEPIESDLSELDLENVTITPSTNTVIIDGEEVLISGVKINNHNYYRISVLRKALDTFRFRSDFEDSNKSYIDTDTKTDIEEFDKEKFESLVGEHDYTLVFNWGPWCYYSRQAMPEMEKLQKYYEDNNLDVQIIGLVDDYENYTLEDINTLFSNNEPAWINFGATDEAYDYVAEIFGTRVNFFPHRILIDKDGNQVGAEFFDYYDEILEEYLEENDKVEDDLTNEEEDLIEKRAYQEFFFKATKTEPLNDEVLEEELDEELVEEEVEEVEDAEEAEEEIEEEIEEEVEDKDEE